MENAEIPGGSVALARMHTAREKHVAFNKVILEAEEQASATDSDIADFLMGFDLSKPLFVAIGVCSQSPLGRLTK
jgi:hypothetical protein